MKTFFSETLIFSSESYGPPKFWILPKLSELCKCCSRYPALSTGEPCTCEHATPLQLFQRGTMRTHWHIAHNL